MGFKPSSARNKVGRTYSKDRLNLLTAWQLVPHGAYWRSDKSCRSKAWTMIFFFFYVTSTTSGLILWSKWVTGLVHISGEENKLHLLTESRKITTAKDVFWPFVRTRPTSRCHPEKLLILLPVKNRKLLKTMMIITLSKNHGFSLVYWLLKKSFTSE